MRRSEMIKVIEDFLSDSTSWKSYNHVAKEILVLIEEVGMLPPISTIDAGPFTGTTDNFWEPEDG